MLQLQHMLQPQHGRPHMARLIGQPHFQRLRLLRQPQLLQPPKRSRPQKSKQICRQSKEMKNENQLEELIVLFKFECKESIRILSTVKKEFGFCQTVKKEFGFCQNCIKPR